MVNHGKASISMGHRKTMASREFFFFSGLSMSLRAPKEIRSFGGQGMAMSLAKNLQAKFEMDPMDPTQNHYSQLQPVVFFRKVFPRFNENWLKISCQIFHKPQVSHNTHQITMVKYWIDSFWSP